MSRRASGRAPRWRRRTERFTRPTGRRSEGEFTVTVTDLDDGLFVLVETDGPMMSGAEFKRRVLELNREAVCNGND